MRDISQQATPEHVLQASWTTNADAWTAAVRQGQIASRRAGTDAAILAQLADLAPRRVLDIGCGEGWLARALAERGVNVVGVDGSAELIARAAELGGGTFRTYSYAAIVADPELLPDACDVVVLNFALLGDDIAPLLKALATRLAPRGCLVIQTVHPWVARGDAPYHDGWRTETFATFGGAFEAPMPWFYRTLATWLAELRAAGLLLERCAEPVDPATGAPLSLLLLARPTAEKGTSC